MCALDPQESLAVSGLFRGFCPLDRRPRLPAGFGFALSEGIDILDGATWDALVAGRTVFMSF